MNFAIKLEIPAVTVNLRLPEVERLLTLVLKHQRFLEQKVMSNVTDLQEAVNQTSQTMVTLVNVVTSLSGQVTTLADTVAGLQKKIDDGSADSTVLVSLKDQLVATNEAAHAALAKLSPPADPAQPA